MTTTKRRRATKRPITGYKLWEGKSWYDGSDLLGVAQAIACRVHCARHRADL